MGRYQLQNGDRKMNWLMTEALELRDDPTAGQARGLARLQPFQEDVIDAAYWIRCENGLGSSIPCGKMLKHLPRKSKGRFEDPRAAAGLMANKVPPTIHTAPCPRWFSDDGSFFSHAPEPYQRSHARSVLRIEASAHAPIDTSKSRASKRLGCVYCVRCVLCGKAHVILQPSLPMKRVAKGLFQPIVEAIDQVDIDILLDAHHVDAELATFLKWDDYMDKDAGVSLKNWWIEHAQSVTHRTRFLRVGPYDCFMGVLPGMSPRHHTKSLMGGIPTPIGGGFSMNASAQGAPVPSRENFWRHLGCGVSIVEQTIDRLINNRVVVSVRTSEHSRKKTELDVNLCDVKRVQLAGVYWKKAQIEQQYEAPWSKLVTFEDLFATDQEYAVKVLGTEIPPYWPNMLQDAMRCALYEHSDRTSWVDSEKRRVQYTVPNEYVPFREKVRHFVEKYDFHPPESWTLRFPESTQQVRSECSYNTHRIASC